jgi:hypothetical protein
MVTCLEEAAASLQQSLGINAAKAPKPVKTKRS